MNTETLKYLENYKDQPSELRNALKEYIRSLGIAPSEQYVVVLEYMLKKPIHSTVDDIFLALSQSIKDLSRSRVYSILDILERIGAVRSVLFDKHTVYYNGICQEHAHMLCRKCGKVVALQMCSDGDSLAAHNKGVIIQDIQLICTGICTDCVQEAGN